MQLGRVQKEGRSLEGTKKCSVMVLSLNCLAALVSVLRPRLIISGNGARWVLIAALFVATKVLQDLPEAARYRW